MILFKKIKKIPIRVSIVVSIPACHAGDRGSIPRHGEIFFLFVINMASTSRANITYFYM